MADEPSHPRPEAVEKPKRKGGKSSSPIALPTTEAGDQTAGVLREKIVAMLRGEALLWANRRRASSIDSNDFDRAYDDIVNPITHPSRVGVIADLCNFVGGAFLGYAINISHK